MQTYIFLTAVVSVMRMVKLDHDNYEFTPLRTNMDGPVMFVTSELVCIVVTKSCLFNPGKV